MDRSEDGRRVALILSLCASLGLATSVWAENPTARIAVNAGATFARLPEAPAEALTFGAVRFDPGQLRVPEQPVLEGQAAMEGPIVHRRTARLRNALDLSADLKIHADAGTILHQTVYPGRHRTDQTYWCGRMKVTAGGPLKGSNRTANICISNGEGHYEVVEVSGAGWLDRGPDITTAPATTTLGEYTLDQSADDLLGPMRFRLLVNRIDPDAVDLEARADRGGQTMWFWRILLPFDQQGVATLPFWNHTLTLTRATLGVDARFRPVGDGSGWDAAKAAHGDAR